MSRAACMIAPLLIAACGSAETADPLPPSPPTAVRSVDGGEIRVAPAGAMTAAGYFVVRNHTGIVDTLVSATSASARKITFDEEMTHDGVTMMMASGPLSIPAHDSLVFVSGSRHLMLDSLVGPLSPGDTVTVVLRFAGGAEETVRFPVKVIEGS